METMEDYYDILGCDRTASFEQLKEAYFSLALKYHPDKCQSQPGIDGNINFQKVDRAWKTLRDLQLRKAYDEDLKQREFNQETLVYGSFSLNELSYDSGEQSYFLNCRCGGQYCFTKNDSDQYDSYLVNCDTCSLTINVDLETCSRILEIIESWRGINLVMEPDVERTFLDLIREISVKYPNLHCPEDRYFVESWICRLREEPNKIARNEYTFNLLKHIKDGQIRFPFNISPPKERLVKYQDMMKQEFGFILPANSGDINSRQYFDNEECSQPRYMMDRLKPPHCVIPRSEETYVEDRRECPPCVYPCVPRERCNEGAGEATVPSDSNKEELDKLIDSICPTTVLEEFATQAARFTSDNGRAMLNFVSKESNHFRQLVQSVFENRNKDISNALDEEQKRVKETYERWHAFITTKTRSEMEAVLKAIPDYRWDSAKTDKEYLWQKIYPKMKTEFNTCLNKPGDEQQKLQRKTWLNVVARDLQEDNSRRRSELTHLSQVLSSLTVSYACSQRKLTEHIAIMECEANNLKNRVIANQRLIEALLTKIKVIEKKDH